MAFTKTSVIFSIAAICAVTAFAVKLPAGFTELEYIGATGVQYIDTGCIPTPSFRAVVDFQYTSQDEQKTGFGYAATGEAQSFRFFRKVTSKGMTYIVNINDSYKTEERFQTSYASGTDTDRHVADLSDAAKYLDGVLFTNGKPGLTKTLAGTFYLFAVHYGWNQSGEYNGYRGNYRIYSAKLYDGNPQTLLRNFVPCCDENGKGGLYDTVNGVMYYNGRNNTNFVLGPAKRPPALVIMLH